MLNNVYQNSNNSSQKNSKENLCLKIKLCNFSDFMELFVPFQFLKRKVFNYSDVSTPY